MRRLLSLAPLLILLMTTQAHAVEGNFLISGTLDGARVADPIGGALHEHDFGFARNVTNSSTVNDLLIGPTTAQVAAETPGVWHPAIIQPDGTRVDFEHMAVYYRNPDASTITTFPFPLGMKHVHGNPHNRSANTYAAVYQCLGASGTSTYIPTSCPLGTGFQETMFFKSCWDGVSLDPPDHKPMKTCDAAHPIHLPAINLIIVWPQTAVGGKLASDLEEPGVAAGLTAHADYWATLDPFFTAKFVERCLNKGIQCRVSNGVGSPAGSIIQFGTGNVIITAAEARGIHP